MEKPPFGAQDQLQIASLGTEFALTEIVGVVAGYWLDSRFDTLPWCSLGGALLGFALGMWLVIDVARRADKEGKHGRS